MARRMFYAISVLALVVVFGGGWFWPPIFWMLVVVLPLIALGVYDLLQKTHTLKRNFPVIGHGRYLMEMLRPEIQQYFVESNVDGTPYSRELRSVIYQRAKGDMQTIPFGTQRDVYRVGYEWLSHSLAPRPVAAQETRVRIGGAACTQPYEASHLNISGMSYGSLGKNAILALNQGAQRGGFFHNTGEGGVTPYHLTFGGDLVWQIGTGYFGCRNSVGRFDAERFREQSAHPNIKMVEIKISQGAKPAHGGILPGRKVTAEIAAIRGVPVGRDVESPAAHSAFSTPIELLEFVSHLRELSSGKPIGFKLCVGQPWQFLGICKAMLEMGILPDFITVDGAEGGTGAAPVEFSNSVGEPLREGLLFVHNALVGTGLRDSIRVVAAGKVATGFHLLRLMALGADLCNAARAMMFALGCIQARRCNTNECPVGIATTDPLLNSGLDVEDKARRVARYHHDTLRAFLELIAAAGLDSPSELRPHHVYRRVAHNQVKSYAEIYEYLEPHALIDGPVPASFQSAWIRASVKHF